MNGTQTLGRAIDILFVLAESGTTLTVSEIAEKVGIPDSTAYRFIQTLIKNGFVERKGRGQIGLACGYLIWRGASPGRSRKICSRLPDLLWKI